MTNKKFFIRMEGGYLIQFNSCMRITINVTSDRKAQMVEQKIVTGQPQAQSPLLPSPRCILEMQPK